MSKLKILEEAGKYINYHETKQQIKSHTHSKKQLNRPSIRVQNTNFDARQNARMKYLGGQMSRFAILVQS